MNRLEGIAYAPQHDAGGGNPRRRKDQAPSPFDAIRPVMDHGDTEQFVKIETLVAAATKSKSTGPSINRDTNRLLEILNAERTFDPTVIAIGLTITQALNARNNDVFRKNTDLLNRILENVYVPKKTGEEKPLNFTPSTSSVLEQIVDLGNHPTRSKQFNNRVQFFPNLLTTTQAALEQHNKGYRTVDIRFGPFTSEELNYIGWFEGYKILISNGPENPDAKIYKVLEHLKQEPHHPSNRPRIFDTTVKGISLKDMQEISYPPSPEILNRITDYLVQQLKSDSTPTFAKYFIALLFTVPKVFFNDDLNQDNNIKLYAISNAWQEHFLDRLLFPGDSSSDTEKKLVKLIYLEGLRKDTPEQLLFSAHACTVAPSSLELPSEIKHNDTTPEATLNRHPLFKRSSEKQSDPGRFGPEELRVTYFNNTVVPKLMAIFEELNIPAENALRKFREIYPEDLYYRNLLKECLIILRQKMGDIFFDNLSQKSGELDPVINNMWGEIQEKAHFLPMPNAADVIELVPKSTPGMMGLKSISIERIETQLPQWNFYVEFTLADNPEIAIRGNLSSDGKFTTRAPFATEAPGIFKMLHLITLATVKDLMSQVKIENKNTEQQEKPSIPENYDQKLHQVIDTSHGIARPASLPRKTKHQSDEDLIKVIAEAQSRKPRRVDLHLRRLKGAERYIEAAGKYSAAIARGAPPEELAALNTALAEARMYKYNISGVKAGSLPDRFQPYTIDDPVTGEEQIVQTWVSPHFNPSLKPGETLSALYKRHYKNTTGLEFLERFKPWFLPPPSPQEDETS